MNLSAWWLLGRKQGNKQGLDIRQDDKILWKRSSREREL